MDDTALARPLEKKLEQLRMSYGGLYWSIYNDVKACGNWCGSMYFSFHNSELAHLYEKILTDIIAQRKKYKE